MSEKRCDDKNTPDTPGCMSSSFRSTEPPQRRIAYYQRMSDNATLEYGCVNRRRRCQLEAQWISK
jgi:hypothetical protein